MRNLFKFLFTLQLLFGCAFAQDKVGEVSIKIGASSVDRSGNVQGLAAGENLYQGDIISAGVRVSWYRTN
ncbi:MAG TPA: hypothetical protein DCM54_00205 [Gammaproteobacteria bacterium]|nr:hypothetical protein [Gammaproteobacteria bacterium]